ncbi:MAG TPA: methyltransferase domain-containing protein [Ktedonobacterales bacterium]|nr:methyltransferase domain-containing protein [Ktedonobacterales bacterium]
MRRQDQTEHSAFHGHPEKIRVAAAYNAAADHFDDDPLAFWDRAGQETVVRMRLSIGARVLDVACGSGASALPAAEQVGPGGAVLGIDLADRLLALGRAKAAARGLAQLEFQVGDMEHLGFPAHSFDAVICVFGIFFVTDMEGLVAALWDLLRPGGQLAITTWGPRMFEPGSTLFWHAVQRERPDLYRVFNPWDRITEPGALRQLLRAGGIDEVELEPEDGIQLLRTPEDFWTIALGSGYRGTIEQLDPDVRERVRHATLADLQERDVRAIETNVIYARARKN